MDVYAIYAVFLFLVIIQRNVVSTALPQFDVNHSLPVRSCTLRDLPTGASRPYRVVIFVDSNFIDVFINWLAYFSVACDNNFAHLDVIAMDAKASRVLKLLMIPASGLSFDLGMIVASESNLNLKLSAIWMKRMEILDKYMRRGIDVIFTDSDALWFHDPLPLISKYSETAQLVASRGSFPDSVFEEWGACICMGFIYIRAGGFGLDFASAITLYLRNQQVGENDTYLDDQEAVNQVLRGWNVRWAAPLSYESSREVTFGYLDKGGFQHTVAMLPHSQVWRKCHDVARSISIRNLSALFSSFDAAAVVHCRIPHGSGKIKAMQMKAFSLWTLTDTWKTDVEAIIRASGSVRLTADMGLVVVKNAPRGGTVSQWRSLDEKLAVFREQQTIVQRQRQVERKHMKAAQLIEEIIKNRAFLKSVRSVNWTASCLDCIDERALQHLTIDELNRHASTLLAKRLRARRWRNGNSSSEVVRRSINMTSAIANRRKYSGLVLEEKTSKLGRRPTHSMRAKSSGSGSDSDSDSGKSGSSVINLRSRDWMTRNFTDSISQPGYVVFAIGCLGVLVVFILESRVAPKRS